MRTTPWLLIGSEYFSVSRVDPRSVAGLPIAQAAYIGLPTDDKTHHVYITNRWKNALCIYEAPLPGTHVTKSSHQGTNQVEYQLSRLHTQNGKCRPNWDIPQRISHDSKVNLLLELPYTIKPLIRCHLREMPYEKKSPIGYYCCILVQAESKV